MNNVQEFKEFINIDFQEEKQEYGHYPFQLIAKNKEGEFTIAALLLGGEVAKCYRAFAKFIGEGCPKVFMSIDFPATLDIETDFVAVFSWDDSELNIVALPYNRETGERLPEVEGKDSEALTLILRNFAMVLLVHEEKLEKFIK